MSKVKYLNSDDLRKLTRRATSFLQIEYLFQNNIPYFLDEFGTPCVRYDDVIHLLSSAIASEVIDGIKLKKFSK